LEVATVVLADARVELFDRDRQALEYQEGVVSPSEIEAAVDVDAILTLGHPTSLRQLGGPFRDLGMTQEQDVVCSRGIRDSPSEGQRFSLGVDEPIEA
jgi:hypothetical protein